MRRFTFTLAFAFSLNAHAQIYGFSSLPAEYNQGNSEVIVKNMPPVRSQDSIGICYAFSAAALLEHSICKEEKLDCSKISDSQRPSVLDLSRYASIPDATGKDAGDPNSYSKSIPDEMTFGLVVLDSVFQTTTVSKESCAPFDHLVSKAQTPSAQSATESAMWKHFESSYNNYKKKFAKCEKCALDEATTTANELISNYNLKTTNTEILKAFAAKTFNEFLYQALVPSKCHRAAGRLSLFFGDKQLKSWPAKNGSKTDYGKTIDKIKSVLSNDQPVMVNRFCTAKPATTECVHKTTNGDVAGGHSFVITGYRKLCNNSGKCKEALKVHNSWGQTWQDQNNDGWVDAAVLLEQTMYRHDSFAWIEPKLASK